jgi:hypothetical protein
MLKLNYKILTLILLISLFIIFLIINNKYKNIDKFQDTSNSGEENLKLIIKSHNGGFFSNFNKMIHYLKNYPNIVEIQFDVRSTGLENQLPFINKDEEIFGKLFEKYKENKNINRILIGESYESQELTDKNAYNFYNENRYKLEPYNKAFTKYIKLQPQLQKKLEYLKNKLHSDCEEVIGIFVRSGALHAEQPNKKLPTRQDYLDAINNINTVSKKTKFFLRIDNNEDLDFYKNILQPNFYTDISRSDNNKKDALHVDSKKYLNLKELEDTYLEVALLSTCNILIHCVSNMATASLYMNMNQKSICISN